MAEHERWEQQLDSFDPQERRSALEKLAASAPDLPPAGENVNLHFHSFFSYNAQGWSPSRIAWEARKAGLYAAGLCDFDVLDGLEEFLAAGELLGLRTTVNLETRVYFQEYADVEITSPGEPGVTYIMGAGFVRVPQDGTPQAEGLAALRRAAEQRNVDLIRRINPHVPSIAIDYGANVMPLTPGGTPTERHIISAYINKARAVLESDEAVSKFWAEVCSRTAQDIVGLLGTPAMDELVRSKLAKRGGLGYVQPSVDTFPPLEEFIDWVASCGAIPMITWLDGTSGGEADGRGLLQSMVAKGAAALNIIPDRNWNIKDPGEKAEKVANLQAIVAAADDLGLPVNIGTEMNRGGLPFADDLSGPVLSRLKDSFLRGAQIMVGHTTMSRFAEVSYMNHDCGVQDKNLCLAAIGALPPVTRPLADKLRAMGPQRARAAIRDAAGVGHWI